MSERREYELAFLQDAAGQFLVGHGPFEERSAPPPDGLAFYRNDYWLSDPKPWKVPRHVERRSRLPVGRPLPAPLVVDWHTVDNRGFAAVYGEVKQAIAGRHLQKAVPVVTERGTIRSGTIRDLAGSLHSLPSPLRGYGWLGADESFLGATPELLLETGDGTLRTMALAGTAPVAERSRFETDHKEIREHELVVRDIAARLAAHGVTRAAPRRVMKIGGLVHFETPIVTDLASPPRPDNLVRCLHPTPALGPLTPTPHSMTRLRSWREHLGCPGWFGAPFGIARQGRLSLVVAIRMVVIQGDRILLPSGCGVIRESRFANEWRELGLKRASVKTVFGLPAGAPAPRRSLEILERPSPRAA